MESVSRINITDINIFLEVYQRSNFYFVTFETETKTVIQVSTTLHTTLSSLGHVIQKIGKLAVNWEWHHQFQCSTLGGKCVRKDDDLQKEGMAGDPVCQKIGITTFSS